MRKGQLLCTLVLIASACGGTASNGLPSPPTVSPAASPASSPSPAGGVAANLVCRLPVTSPTTVGDPAPGGWVTFPGGQFVRDEASLQDRLEMHLPSYDRAIEAWVPMEPEYIAPDGATYVLHNESTLGNDKSGYFYLVDAKTGQRRLLNSQEGPYPGAYWTVVNFASEGIYLSAPAYGMTRQVRGLWLMDPKTGAIRLINGDHYWVMVSGGVAWAQDPPGHPGKGSNMYRLDLLTGNVITWYQAKMDMRLLAPTPEGEMLVDYGKIGAPRLALLARSGLFVPIQISAPLPPIYTARIAPQGVWLGIYGEAWSGIALYVKGEGVTVMARSKFSLDAAGSCG
jgi:hypothetical protein